MNDLISRQEALDAICEEGVRLERNGMVAMCEIKQWCIDLLEQLPSAQPERKKGKWIRHDEIKNVYGGVCIECSECGEKYVVQHILDEKYCRNCGADMRGEEDE